MNKKKLILMATAFFVLNAILVSAQIDTTVVSDPAPDKDWYTIVSYILNAILGVIGVSWVPKVKARKDKAVILLNEFIAAIETGQTTGQGVRATVTAAKELVDKEK